MSRDSYSSIGYVGRDLEILWQTVLPNLLQLPERILGPYATWRDLLSLEYSELADLAAIPPDFDGRLRWLDRQRKLWKFRGIRRDVPVYESGREHAQRFPSERWVFINGIFTDEQLLLLSGAYLSQLFERRVELVHNPTDGIGVDLIESFFGRTLDLASTPARALQTRVRALLEAPEVERVVLLGHSQGAIILSNVVHELIAACQGADWIEKLEVYTFGSAADHVPLCQRRTQRLGRNVPYYEHYANRGDLVAQLGVLQRRLEIRGPVYVREASGHLLNAHYLQHIAAGAFWWRGTAESRLRGYLEGRVPQPLSRSARAPAVTPPAPTSPSAPRPPARSL